VTYLRRIIAQQTFKVIKKLEHSWVLKYTYIILNISVCLLFFYYSLSGDKKYEIVFLFIFLSDIFLAKICTEARAT